VRASVVRWVLLITWRRCSGMTGTSHAIYTYPGVPTDTPLYRPFTSLPPSLAHYTHTAPPAPSPNKLLSATKYTRTTRNTQTTHVDGYKAGLKTADIATFVLVFVCVTRKTLLLTCIERICYCQPRTGWLMSLQPCPLDVVRLSCYKLLAEDAFNTVVKFPTRRRIL